MRFAGAASSRASRSCARSTSWTSSTSRWRAARAPPGEQAASSPRGPRAPDRPGRRSRGRRARRAARSYATNARATGPAPASAATSAAVTPRSSLSRENAVSRRARSATLLRGRQLGEELAAVDERLDRPRRRRAGSRGPSAWNVRTRTGAGRDAERREGGVEPFGQLVGRPLVEGDRARCVAGSVPPSTSQASRATSVVVLPRARPAPRTGPGPAARWPPPAGRRRAAPSRAMTSG